MARPSGWLQDNGSIAQRREILIGKLLQFFGLERRDHLRIGHRQFRLSNYTVVAIKTGQLARRFCRKGIIITQQPLTAFQFHLTHWGRCQFRQPIANNDETPGIKTFRLVNPTGGPVPFEFLPGQFLTLAVAQAGSTTKRSYTIASSAEQRGYVEITVKREEKGVVSRYLHDRVAPGDLQQVAAPQGRFTFTGAEADGIVLIGGGVGITPLMSVVRSLTDRGWDKDIFLLFACRTSADFVFREELEHLQKRHPNLHVVATMSRADGTAWMGPKGRMTKELITQWVPDIARRRVHLCGPATMMDATRAMLLELGVPGEQIRTEAFGPAGSKGDRQATVQAAMVEPSPATPVVAFTISSRSAPLPAGTSVLEAAEHVGVAIDNSCRAGTCGQCKVRLRKGSVTMAVQDALSPEEKASGIVLACQAQATTNLEVEA
ncbi:2Fe-2S iron-sulfur cluster-binding protein [Leptolyngbya sp. 7M]|uniref:2Fe-2S iron-sulfur cluster-binding protein n=1 Tax=Leptolyngbya sp. 7M TaxID=2812896 RepID=UPI001CECCA51